MANGRKKKRTPVGEDETTAGYRSRQEEADFLEEAADAGSTQAKTRLGQAETNLERQAQIIKLRRKKPAP